MLIIEGLLFVGAVIATFVIGTPVAVALAAPHRWTRVAVRDPSTRKQRTDVVRAFAPLDLGPDPVRWPSERLWELKSTLGTPEWPSKSWNDEHFGRHWKDSTAPPDGSERGFHAMAARRHREDSTAPAAVGAPPSTPHAGRERPVVVQQRRQRQVGEEPRHRQQQPTAETARKLVVAPAPVRAEAVMPPPPVAKNRPPDEAELEHLIASVGLAGTVQAIMQRTGWEFRDAAQYLARVRRG